MSFEATELGLNPGSLSFLFCVTFGYLLISASSSFLIFQVEITIPNSWGL